MLRVQMLHQHKAHARIRRQMFQQFLKRLKSPRRSPHSHNGKSALGRRHWDWNRGLLFEPRFACRGYRRGF
jgi:hypothetical protein